MSTLGSPFPKNSRESWLRVGDSHVQKKMMSMQRPAARLDKRVSTPHVYAALQHNPIRLAFPNWIGLAVASTF
jgi:hypothetical protein